MNGSQWWILSCPVDAVYSLRQPQTGYLTGWIEHCQSSGEGGGLRIMNKRVVMMNIVEWIAAFVERTDLLVEQWATAKVEKGFSDKHAEQRDTDYTLQQCERTQVVISVLSWENLRSLQLQTIYMFDITLMQHRQILWGQKKKIDTNSNILRGQFEISGNTYSP